MFGCKPGGNEYVDFAKHGCRAMMFVPPFDAKTETCRTKTIGNKESNNRQMTSIQAVYEADGWRMEVVNLDTHGTLISLPPSMLGTLGDQFQARLFPRYVDWRSWQDGGPPDKIYLSKYFAYTGPDAPPDAHCLVFWRGHERSRNLKGRWAYGPMAGAYLCGTGRSQEELTALVPKSVNPFWSDGTYNSN